MYRKRKIIISVLILVLVALLGGCAYFYHTISAVANVKTICDGISIDGCDVSGMNMEEALEAVTSWEEEISDTAITITYENHNETKKLSDFGYSYGDLQDAVKEAYEIGKEGSMWARYKAIKEGAGKGTEIAIEKSVSEEAFQAYLDDNADNFVKVATNATLSRENGAFVITDEQKGMEVPVKENVDSLNTYINDKWDYEAFSYELIANVAEPEYTREDLEKIKDVLGTYTTNFSTSGYNRIQNIKNACEKIDGVMIYPNEEFSVMDKILPFTAENGYLEAGSYSSGEVIQSYGGGVCQVATTLYNSVLLAELEVTERHNHQMVVSYVPLSRDAAVSDTGNQDFKFVNNTETPIYLEGYVDGYNITFTLYGCETRDSSRTIEYVSEKTATIQPGKDIETKDKTLEKDKKIVTQEAHIGYKANLWKYVYVNGELESKTQINSSYYAPSARRVTVGTKKTEDEEEDKDKDKDKDKTKDSKDSTTEEKPSKKTTEAPATEAPVQNEVTTEAPVDETTEAVQ